MIRVHIKVRNCLPIIRPAHAMLLASVFLCLDGFGATQEAPAPAPLPRGNNAPVTPTDVQQLESLRDRHSAFPGEPIYEYGIEGQVNADAKVAALRAQIAAYEANVAVLREKYVESAPQLKKALEELETLKKRVEELLHGLRTQALDNALARARGNEPLADQPGLQAYPIDELVNTDPRVTEILAELAPVEVTYQQMKATYVDEAPQLKIYQRKLNDLNERLTRTKALVRQELGSAAHLTQQGIGVPGVSPAGVSPPSIPAPVWAAAPAVQSKEERALDATITLDLQTAHLQTIVDKMSQTLGLNFVVDSRAVEPITTTAGINQKESFVTDGMVQAVKLTSVPLRKALESLLDPLGLDYSVQPGFIWISTPSRIHHETFEPLETRQYVLRNFGESTRYNVNRSLPGAKEGQLDLLEVLQLSLPHIQEPATGAVLSRIEYDASTRQLTLRNTPTNLRRAEALLELVNAVR